MAVSLVLLFIALAVTSTSALDKQIKLEDIERDNLQTELVRRPSQPQPTAQQEQINQLRQQQQLHLQQQALHRQQQLAYQQQLLQQRYSAAQEPRYSAAQAERYSAQEQQPLTYHQQFQQQIQQHREQALMREREKERERPEHQQQQTLQHYAPATQQLLQEVSAGTPHVMYLIMPGGNIAAIPIAHPNQLQALLSPAKPHYNAYQTSPVGVPTQVVQAYYQPQTIPVPAHTATQTETEQPAARTQLQYVLPSQQHRITFSQARPEYSQARPEYSQARPEYSQARPEYSQARPEYSSQAQQAVVYRESSQADTEFQYTPQSQKSIFSSGIKSTAAPQLKGATGFSTQTGSSYANFRQYSG